MKFGIVIFPGSNCDHDAFYTLKNVLKNHTVELWHKNRDLQNVDAIVIPGGFSYGDYLRAGAIAKLSPVMDEIQHFVKKGGPVIGICNGFQILLESGLLEGALITNQSTQFVCKSVFIRAQNKHTIFTEKCGDKPLQMPIAHQTGNYFVTDDLLKRLQDNGQIAFRYCDEKGNISEKSNPNGSIFNIAGITNRTGNVLGMMPHPERATENILGSNDGKLIFESTMEILQNA